MPRQNQTSEHNTFVAGLITEASPLTFPDNAAVDINNFVLSKTGKISRRLGMDFEPNYEVNRSTYVGSSEGEPVASAFNWTNAGGNPDELIIVTQVGETLNFFGTQSEPFSGNLLYSINFPEQFQGNHFDFAVVDGVLVVCGGATVIYTFNYVDGAVVYESRTYEIRDEFGLEHVVDGVDMRDSNNVTKRLSGSAIPTTIHNYNMRNSGWATFRIAGNEELLRDPVLTFYNTSLDPKFLPLGGGLLPSYSDNLNLGLYPDANDGDDRIVERFFANTLLSNQAGNFPNSMGYFIIDALNRGASRLDKLTELFNSASPYAGTIDPDEIPADRTPEGAKCVAEFAGRVFYSGFTGEVVNGDSYSPKMSSYVLFSKVVETPADIGRCYQVGDPTSIDNSELLATDGGFIRLDGAYGIKRLLNIGSSLIALAENGVWAITGGSDYGFSATDYKVVKVSDKGCAGAKTAVVVDNTVMYWGYDGIYHVQANQFGDLGAVNISSDTIQTYYDSISAQNKLSCQGYYDSYERKVRWVFGNRLLGLDDSVELVLDVALPAFYKHTITGSGTGRPNVICPFEVPPYRVGSSESDVFVGEDNVLVGADQVIVNSTEIVSGVKEIYYLAVINVDATGIDHSFCRYGDTTFADWGTVDARAELVTGWAGGS